MGSHEEMSQAEGRQKLEIAEKARDFELMAHIPLALSWIPVNNTQAAVNTLDKIRSVSVYWNGKLLTHEHQH